MLDGLSHGLIVKGEWNDDARKQTDDYLTNVLIDQIERELTLFLKTDKVYYSYTICKRRLRSGEGECRDSDHRSVWVGPGLKRFVTTLIRKVPLPFALYATSARTKGKQVDGCPDDCRHWDPPYAECTDHIVNSYWIGDIGPSGQMICCDDLWWMMWNRLLDRKGLNQSENQPST